MKSAKKSILKAVAKVGAKSAEIGTSSASMLGYHLSAHSGGNATANGTAGYYN